MPKRDSKGRFVSGPPGGGDSGGGKDTVADGLRARLARLVKDPDSSAREIGQIMRALVSASQLALIDRQIALLDQRIEAGSGGDTGLAAMLRKADEYDETHGNSDADVR